MQKVGVLGGTFNPIHIGHLIAAQEVLQRAGLDKIIFMPSGNPPHKPKQNIVSAHHRYNMVKLAIEDNDSFGISDLEIKRLGKTYTYDTLIELQKSFCKNKLYFILGFDALKYMDYWKNVDEVFKLCSFIVVNRGNFETEMHYEIKRKIEKYGADIQVVSIPNIEVSSTEIRRRISMDISIRYLTTDSIIEYIDTNGLYRGEEHEGL